ncbi:leucine-rich repeat protein [Candidatus Saccharibacteria bacterium TM7i]|nr:leucine-rich repeat protein [Candidatus Saccharibacteria bacterium TM7i]
MTNQTRKALPGFTIIELLIVIVVIAILAVIIVVSYNGITNQAHKTAVKADLKTAHTKILSYQAQKGELPASLGQVEVGDTDKTQFTYSANGATFCVDAKSTAKDIQFSMTEKGVVTEGACTPLVAGPTAESCFSTVADAIYDYFDYQGNNPANPACPRNVIIPSVIEGETITTIEYAAMAGKGLTSVVLPSTVTHIFDNAFQGNGMTSATIPQTVTYIGAYAFTGNALTSVTINANSVFGNPFDPGVTVNYY